MASVQQAISLLKEAERNGDTERASAIRERLNAAGYNASAVREMMLGEYSQVGSALRGAAQGATFGFSDEVEAAFRSALDSEREYEEVLRQVRQDYDLSQEANPATYMGAEIAGGFAVPGVGAIKGAANLARVAPRMSAGARLAGVGAAEGAVAGAGYSDAESAAGVASDAATGALIGAPSAVVGGKVMQKGSELAVRGYDAIRSGLTDDPARAAKLRLQRRLEQAGYDTPEAIQARLAELGPEARLADLDPILQQEAIGMSRVPGRGRQTAVDFVRARQEGQQARLKQAGREAVDPKWEDYRGYINTLDAQLEKQAREAYGDAYSKMVEPTPDLARMSRMPIVQRAMARAQEALQNDPDLYMDGTGLSADGLLSTRWLDKTIRVLRDDASELARSGRGDEAAAVYKTIDRMKAELYKSNPELEAAHSIYRGGREMKEAAEFGRDLLQGNKRLDDYLDMAKDFSESENESFRVGLLQGMFDRIQKAATDRDAAGRVIPSGEVESILRQIFKDKGEEQVFEEFMRKVSAEKEFSFLRNRVTSNSITAEAQEAIRGDVPLSLGELTYRVLRAMGASNNKLQRLTSEEYAELGEMLFGDVTKMDLEEVIAPTLGIRATNMNMGSTITKAGGGAAASVGTGAMTEMMQ